MQNERKDKERIVKKKIAQILVSVKEEKQHIENQLARNDLRIRQYCEQYQKLRHQTDLSTFSFNQLTILNSLIEGLKASHIDPQDIFGKNYFGRIQKQLGLQKEEDDIIYGHLEEDALVKVQQSLINNLLEKIEQVQKKKENENGYK